LVRSIDREITRRILVRCPNWVGDLTMATPALKAIRNGFPDSHITWLVRASLKKVIENLPYCDEILEYEERRSGFARRRLLSWAARLRERKIDLAVIFPNSFSSAFMAFLAGIKRRIGYSREGRRILLTDPIEPIREGSRIVPVPMVKYYLRITEAMECPSPPPKPELAVSLPARQEARAILARHGIDQEGMIIVMIPGAAYGSSKCWEPSYFAEVGDRLTDEYGCSLLIIPGPGEEQIAREIEAEMQNRPVVLSDPIVPLDVLMAVIQRSSLVITNDTGPRHFAVALDRPVVVIMGPTDPRYTNLNLEKTALLRENLECSPCHLKICPREHQCMTAIKPEQVIQASERLIHRFVEPHGRTGGSQRKGTA